MRKFFAAILFCIAIQVSFTQVNDNEASHQYVIWLKEAIEEDRIIEAKLVAERALDFYNVNSDISFLAAFINLKTVGSRPEIINHLDNAIDVNRWYFYSENEALVLKAEMLIAMRRYLSALSCLDKIREGDTGRDPLLSLYPLSADAAMLRLKALRGLAFNSLDMQEITAYGTLTLFTLNRFSRDPRPAVIFLEYLHYRKNHNTNIRFEIDKSDQQVLDLIIRRLPVLAELDPEIAWMISPFLPNEEDAKRYLAAYRAGGFLQNAAGFMPNPGSIPQALNLGLINDFQAVEELFRGKIEFESLNNTYALLRSEEGRDLFTKRLNDFSGYITAYDPHTGLIESLSYYADGSVKYFDLDINHTGIMDLKFIFDSGDPIHATVFVSGSEYQADVAWERYPFVLNVTTPQEFFSFSPAFFNFAPLDFIMIGGAQSRHGIIYPVLSNNIYLSRRAMVSFCSSIDRPSEEFEEAVERIVLESGIPVQALEFLGEKIISITEFEGGIPVIQYVDLDLDGRMETIRRFHRPQENHSWFSHDEKYDYKSLIASSESDWTGDGKYKTGEVYLEDGSVVYKWDIDGSGLLNYNDP